MSLIFADIATEIFDENDSPDDLSIPAISYWLRNGFTALNSRISTSYSLDPVTLESTPSIGEEEKNILKKLFLVYYYGKLIRSNLGAAGVQTATEVSSDGASVRMVSKTDIASRYGIQKREEEQALADLITAYKLDKAGPQSVSGDDFIDYAGQTRIPGVC